VFSHIHPYAVYRELAARFRAAHRVARALHDYDRLGGQWRHVVNSEHLAPELTCLRERHPEPDLAAEDGRARALVAAEVSWWRQRGVWPERLVWVSGQRPQLERFPGALDSLMPLIGNAAVWMALTDQLTRAVAGEQVTQQRLCRHCGVAMDPPEGRGRPRAYCEKCWPLRRTLNRQRARERQQRRGR
jgi:hypothetical protein